MTRPFDALIPREAWGAAAPTAAIEAHTIDRVTLHHTAVLLDDRPAAQRLRAYQRYHQQQGWPDIAYHLLIGADGLVYEGRSLEVRGNSATGYDPSGHLLVAVDGDFTREHPIAPQVDALAALLAWAADTFALASDAVRGHSDYAATACPGEHLAALLEDGSLTARGGTGGVM